MLSALDAARRSVTVAAVHSHAAMFPGCACAPAAALGQGRRSGAAQASSLDSLQQSLRAATFMMSAISISFCSAAASHRYRLQSCGTDSCGARRCAPEGSGWTRLWCRDRGKSVPIRQQSGNTVPAAQTVYENAESTGLTWARARLQGSGEGGDDVVGGHAVGGLRDLHDADGGAPLRVAEQRQQQHRAHVALRRLRGAHVHRLAALLDVRQELRLRASTTWL